VLVLISMPLGGFETGWTGYPPLSTRPDGHSDFFLGVWVIGWSSVLGGLNLIATILRMRTPGMTLFRMPILVWAVLATSIITLTATQLIGLSFQLVMFERLLKMPFFTRPRRQPDPVPAPVLVLLAPGGVRLRAARLWRDQRAAAGLRPQAAVWLQVDRAVFDRHRGGRLPGVGASYVHRRHGRIPARAVHVQHAAGGRADRGQGV
jgi:hypothetical protein